MTATAILAWILLIVVVSLLFPPLRGALVWLFGQAWTAFLGLVNLLASMAQGTLKSVAYAHVVVLRNLAPRGIVLPTVKKEGTVRRD
jgi:hypothetical protein